MMMDGVPGIRAAVVAAVVHSFRDAHPGAGGVRTLREPAAGITGFVGRARAILGMIQAALRSGTGAAMAASPRSRRV